MLAVGSTLLFAGVMILERLVLRRTQPDSMLVVLLVGFAWISLGFGAMAGCCLGGYAILRNRGRVSGGLGLAMGWLTVLCFVFAIVLQIVEHRPIG